MPASSPSAPLGGAPDQVVGTLLGGRYRVLSRLGEGGMGTVYLCEHAVLQRKLAVKVLRPSLAGDPELVDRFRNEAIAASRIGQENVVDVLDFGAGDDGSLYYVMEALEGRSLGAVIREEGPLRIPRALDVLEQICRALAAAHARGVVHRDVKPDNVFVIRREDGSERVKLIDFGISHVPRAAGAAPITRAGAIIGTPEYMAPEQAAGEPVDPRADVYAAGVLAFEMLTGELPIEAATPIATLVAHQLRDPDPPSRRRPSIPPDVDALVLRALAKRPEHRFESMEALAGEVCRVRAALAAANLARTPPVSRPRAETVALPESAEHVRRASRRSRRVVPVLAALAAAGAIAASAWAVIRLREGSTAIPTSTATATATPTSTPTATPTSTATPTATSSGIAVPPSPSRSGGEGRGEGAVEPVVPPVHAPVLVDDPRPASRQAPAPLDPRPARKVVRRAGPDDAEPARAPELKDPYSSGGDLKDPFP